MLERTAATLVQSTEAIALEEATTTSHLYSHLRIYQNVIVTTADLRVCRFDPASIDLSTGEIGDSATFEEVPYLRFRKQLMAYAPDENTSPATFELQSKISARESTVFVVNSARFFDFLNDCELPDDLHRYISAR